MAYKDQEQQREYRRRWRAANREKDREQQRRYVAANREKVRKKNRRYRAANREKEREQQRRSYAANPEKMRERRRRYEAANPEKVRESQRRWQSHLAAEVIAAYGGKCVCCETTEDLALDHIRPGQPPEDFDGSGRGRHRSTTVIRLRLKAAGWPKDQVQVLCRYCNVRKGRKETCPCGGAGNPQKRHANFPRSSAATSSD